MCKEKKMKIGELFEDVDAKQWEQYYKDKIAKYQELLKNKQLTYDMKKEYEKKLKNCQQALQKIEK